MKNDRKIFNCLSLFLCCVLPFSSFLAQETSPKEVLETPWTNMKVDLGVYIADISSKARFGSRQLGIGVDVDFEKAFGLETNFFVFKEVVCIGLVKRRGVMFNMDILVFKGTQQKSLLLMWRCLITSIL